ncbi:hypothetical protein ACF5W4_09305 [Bacillota bacterium Lsc_1132]
MGSDFPPFITIILMTFLPVEMTFVSCGIRIRSPKYKTIFINKDQGAAAKNHRSHETIYGNAFSIYCGHAGEKNFLIEDFNSYEDRLEK